jgi:lysophospholipase L1-like esterase
MKNFIRFISLTFALVFSAIFYVQAQSQGIATPPLQIKDVPPETQRGPGTGRYEPPIPAKAELPTLWLIGDSTVRNGSKGDNGPDGQWGWGGPITAYFDLSKINVVNRALGGTSSRSFYTTNLWKDLKPLVKKGDYVMMQFGHNDGGKPEGVYPNGRASLRGVGEETKEVETTPGTKEVVHTFGWYLKQFVAETRAQGATPIICSLTPRKRWSDDGKFGSVGSGVGHAEWAEQTAKEINTLFVPLYVIASQTYQKLGREKVDTFFVPSPKESLHTGWDGAVVNAECVVAGLKALRGAPFKEFFSERAKIIAPWTSTPTGSTPISSTPIAAAPDAQATKPTIFVVGDSTASNNAGGAKGWGDSFASLFDGNKVNVLNRARAGRSTRTYTAEGSWDNVLKELKAGDFVLIQFGHNDGGKVDDKGRASLWGLGEDTQEVTKADGTKEAVHTFGWYLRKFIADTRAKGATPILLSLTVRNIWKDGKVERGNGRYGQWAAEVAKTQGVPFLDVNNIIADHYERMGQEKVKAMFGPDYVHTSPAGADLNAQSAAEGLRILPVNPLAAYLKAETSPAPTTPFAQ